MLQTSKSWTTTPPVSVRALSANTIYVLTAYVYTYTLLCIGRDSWNLFNQAKRKNDTDKSRQITGSTSRARRNIQYLIHTTYSVCTTVTALRPVTFNPKRFNPYHFGDFIDCFETINFHLFCVHSIPIFSRCLPSLIIVIDSRKITCLQVAKTPITCKE